MAGKGLTADENGATEKNCLFTQQTRNIVYRILKMFLSLVKIADTKEISILLQVWKRLVQFRLICTTRFYIYDPPRLKTAFWVFYN